MGHKSPAAPALSKVPRYDTGVFELVKSRRKLPIDQPAYRLPEEAKILFKKALL